MSDRDQCCKCKFLATIRPKEEAIFFCNFPVPDWVENPTQIVDPFIHRTCPCFETPEKESSI